MIYLFCVSVALCTLQYMFTVFTVMLSVILLVCVCLLNIAHMHARARACLALVGGL